MDDLGRALERERALIVSGDLAGLAALALSLPLLAERAGPGPAAARLAVLARRNRRLLLAAITGVRDAARHRAAMADARARLSSYDQRGERVAATDPAPRVERRA